MDKNVAILFDFANNKRATIKQGLSDSIYLNVAAGFLAVGKVANLREGVHITKNS